MKGNCQGCGRWINNGNYCGKCLGIPNAQRENPRPHVHKWYPLRRNGVVIGRVCSCGAVQ